MVGHARCNGRRVLQARRSTSEYGLRFAAWVVALASAMFASACGGDRGTTDQSAAGEPQIGHVSEALGTAPESNCTGVAYNGHDYWFCRNALNWVDAEAHCEAQSMHLVSIDTQSENDFLGSTGAAF